MTQCNLSDFPDMAKNIRSGELKEGKWVEMEKPPGENEIAIGETLVGKYISERTNPLFKTDVMWTFMTFEKVDGTPVMREIYETTDLKRWMSLFEPGDVLCIRRLDDKKMPPPMHDKKMYVVAKWQIK